MVSGRLGVLAGRAVRYFHGGVPGLRRGDRLLPPSQTTTPHTLYEYSKDIAGGEVVRPDRVYVVTRRKFAEHYAHFYPEPGGGWVYEVRPDAPLEPDPDCTEPGLSWQTPAATILRVFR